MYKRLQPWLRKNYFWILILIVGLEVALLTFWRRELGIFGGPVGMLLLGLLITILPIWRHNQSTSSRFKTTNSRLQKLIPLIVSVIGVAVLIPIFYAILDKYPIDIYKSDIHLTIKVCVERFLRGESVYTPITDFHYDHYPNYLPLKWAPFILAEWLDVDYRWLPFVMGISGVFLYQYHLTSKTFPWYLILLLSLAPWLVLLYYHLHMPWNMAYTVELMDLAYHLFFFFVLVKGKVLLRGISIVFILLSRYSIIFWLPLWWLLSLIFAGKKEAIKTALIIAIGITSIYLLPVLLPNPGSFAKGQDAYLLAAQGSWRLSDTDIEKGEVVPHVMRDGVGMASYFYVWGKGSELDKIKTIRITHILASLLTVFLIGLFYFKSNYQIPPKYYSLFSLKIYLAVFYGFIQVPFFYLFITPLFLSFFILLEMEPKPAVHLNTPTH